jgi:hypothetical protein
MSSLRCPSICSSCRIAVMTVSTEFTAQGQLKYKYVWEQTDNGAARGCALSRLTPAAGGIWADCDPAARWRADYDITSSAAVSMVQQTWEILDRQSAQDRICFEELFRLTPPNSVCQSSLSMTPFAPFKAGRSSEFAVVCWLGDEAATSHAGQAAMMAARRGRTTSPVKFLDDARRVRPDRGEDSDRDGDLRLTRRQSFIRPRCGGLGRFRARIARRSSNPSVISDTTSVCCICTLLICKTGTADAAANARCAVLLDQAGSESFAAEPYMHRPGRSASAR